MSIDDQTEVIAFLSSPAAHDGRPVERIETHASIVFLAGERAWKLKRAVRYDYLDFSTLDRRRAMCEAEVRLNRRFAPSLYRGVAPVTRGKDGQLCLGGSGAAVEWLVEMVRFDQDLLLDRMAARQALAVTAMTTLAAEVARLHGGAAPRPQHGGQSAIAAVIDGNATSLSQQAAGSVDAASARRMTDLQRVVLARVGPLLDRRRDAGRVRQCHGDLHLRNIVMLDGTPTPFDGIEFNDDLSCIDVLYDLAFLLMDLWRRRLPAHANVVWNRYLGITADFDGLPALPLLLSCRAAVRAKTSLTAATLAADDGRRAELQRLAREYVRLGTDLLRPPAPCVIAVGGLSGSGKSTLARDLAPALGAVPGAIVLRSDEVRKALAGVPASASLPPGAYGVEMSARVYGMLIDRAREVAGGGYVVIVDAVFLDAGQRAAIEQTASDAGVSFAGLWLHAPEAVLVERVRARRGDASDADVDVVRAQCRSTVGATSWTSVDAAGQAAAVLRNAAAALRPVVGASFNS
jgi:hypothetical protein